VWIITTGRLTQFISNYPDSEKWVKAWKKVTRSAKWQSLVDVRKTYPSADPVQGFTVFDVNHNKYRLITKIEYRYQMVFIKFFLTHAEYSKGDWKK
jgi:mRNA interferase HigB